MSRIKKMIDDNAQLLWHDGMRRIKDGLTTPEELVSSLPEISTPAYGDNFTSKRESGLLNSLPKM